MLFLIILKIFHVSFSPSYLEHTQYLRFVAKNFFPLC